MKPIMGKKRRRKHKTHAQNLAYVKKKKGVIVDKESIV